MGDLSKHFNKSEMACSCCGECKVTASFLAFADALREEYGGPISPSSAYRCPKHNSEVGGAAKSSHVRGEAFDIPTKSSNHRFELVKAAFKAAEKLEMSLQIEIGVKGAAKWVHFGVDPTKGANILYTNQEA